MQGNGLPLKQEWDVEHSLLIGRLKYLKNSLNSFFSLILQNKYCKVIDEAHFLSSHSRLVCSCVSESEKCVVPCIPVTGLWLCLCRAGGTPRTARWSRCGPRWCPTITCRARRAPWPRPSRAPSERPRSTSATAPTGTGPASWCSGAGTAVPNLRLPLPAASLVHPVRRQSQWRDENER